MADVRLTLDPPWGEHMVVQAGRDATPAGTAPAGAQVNLRFADSEASTFADAEGRWRLGLPVPKVGGPYEFSVRAGDLRIDYSDVLVGEVWLASGQSNMEWPLASSLNAQLEVASSEQPRLRLFKVLKTVGRLEGRWTPCTPEQAKDFSAVAYHFGRTLAEQGLGPLGLVQSVWGGTQAEPWMEPEHAGRLPHLQKIFQRWDQMDPGAQAVRTQGAAFQIAYRDALLLAEDGTQTPLKLSGERYTVQVESKVEHRPGHFAGWLGPDAWTFAFATPQLNDWSPYCALQISVKADCDFDFSLGTETSPDGDYHAFRVVQAAGSDWKTYRFDFNTLAQRGWGAAQTLNISTVSALVLRVLGLTFPPERPGLLFDTMIRPLGAFGFKGVLWYQGESNQARRHEYGEILTALIKGWRAFFGDPRLPFLVAQLPDIGVPGGEDPRDWATLREQQMQVLNLDATGLSVNLGLGDGNDAIHPRNKRPVGERLAQEALRVAYGRPQAYGHGPRFVKAERLEGAWRLQFDTFGGTLRVLGAELRGFEGRQDGAWQPVAAQMDGSAVLVPDVDNKIMGLRYAWHDSPLATLGDSRQLPAFGFRFES